jgi:hypothetical protein
LTSVSPGSRRLPRETVQTFHTSRMSAALPIRLGHPQKRCSFPSRGPQYPESILDRQSGTWISR